MKKTLSVLLLVLCFQLNAQTDYSLARAGDYVMGVRLFILCEPVNEYDFVAKIKGFNPLDISSKDIEKIIKKARKKNPHFDGIIIKRNYKHVELIKFREKKEAVQGFRVGDEITFKHMGKVTDGTILILDDAREKAVVEFFDENGEDQTMKVPLKKMSRK